MDITLASPAPRSETPPLRPLAVLRATGGWLLLAVVALAAEPNALVESAPLTLAAPAGALLLTVPALLVGHQFLNLRAAPSALLSALLRGYCGAGDVALGLTPLALLFSATSALGPLILMVTVGGAGLQALAVTLLRLARAEDAATAEPDLAAKGRMVVLGLAWAALTALIGLRLSFDLANSLF